MKLPRYPKYKDSGVKWLGGITLAVSIMVAVLGESGAELARLVVFTPERFWHGWIWQAFTYTFLTPDLEVQKLVVRRK